MSFTTSPPSNASIESDPDRLLWLAIRRALVLIVRAIEVRWSFPRSRD